MKCFNTFLHQIKTFYLSDRQGYTYSPFFRWILWWYLPLAFWYYWQDACVWRTGSLWLLWSYFAVKLCLGWLQPRDLSSRTGHRSMHFSSSQWLKEMIFREWVAFLLWGTLAVNTLETRPLTNVKPVVILYMKLQVYQGDWWLYTMKTWKTSFQSSTACS